MAEESCLNCGRGDREVPILTWRYQGEPLWICSSCIPYLIHHTDVVMAKVEAKNRSQSAASTGKQAE